MNATRPVPLPRTIEFWFEFASPYSHLAAARIEGLAQRAGHRIRYRPFLLGPIFQALHGTAESPFNRNPARGANMWQDVARQAARAGIPLRRPSRFPRISLLATRIALLGEEEPWIGRFTRRIFDASFGDDASIGEEAVVRRVLVQLELPADDLIAAAGRDETKQRLRARSEEAAARGLFGAPTFFAGGEMYWGNDRLEEALGLATFAGSSPEDARAFAARWLPAWTGNDPERLLSFYTEDAIYLDPAVPAGIRGHEALGAYFRKLLARNPAWIWTQREAIPMESGFVNLWHAAIPVGDARREVDGVCLVSLRGDRIARNEVYFDRGALFPARG